MFEGVPTILYSDLNIENSENIETYFQEWGRETFQYKTVFLEVEGVNIPYLYIGEDRLYLNTYLVYDFFNPNDNSTGFGVNSISVAFIVEEIANILTDEVISCLDDWDENLLREIEGIPLIYMVISRVIFSPYPATIFSSRVRIDSPLFFVNIFVFSLLFSICYFLLKFIFYKLFRIKDKNISKKGFIFIIVAVPFLLRCLYYYMFKINSYGFRMLGEIGQMKVVYCILVCAVVSSLLGLIYSVLQSYRAKKKMME